LTSRRIKNELKDIQEINPPLKWRVVENKQNRKWKVWLETEVVILIK
jgi:hypothetical protein